MEITASNHEDWTVLEVSGSVDASTAPAFQAEAMGRIGQGAKKMAIDVSKVEYMSSAGLRVLLMIFKALKAGGGAMCMLSPSPFVAEVLELSGFSGIMPVAENREALS